MPDVFKLFAKTFLVISMVTFLASALMSGNLDPTSWDGHSFESSVVNTLGWITGGFSAIIFLLGLIAERATKATERKERREMQISDRRFGGPPIGDWQQRYYDPRQY